MNTTKRKLVSAAIGIAALSCAFGASAHDRDDSYRGWDRGWERSAAPGWGRGWGHEHWREERCERRVYAPPVFYRPAPPVMYQPRVYYERPTYYAAPRSPAVVIGVDVPPIVIPLR